MARRLRRPGEADRRALEEHQLLVVGLAPVAAVGHGGGEAERRRVAAGVGLEARGAARGRVDGARGRRGGVRQDDGRRSGEARLAHVREDRGLG